MPRSSKHIYECPQILDAPCTCISLFFPFLSSCSFLFSFFIFILCSHFVSLSLSLSLYSFLIRNILFYLFPSLIIVPLIVIHSFHLKLSTSFSIFPFRKISNSSLSQCISLSLLLIRKVDKLSYVPEF